MVLGKQVRDYKISSMTSVIFPYDEITGLVLTELPASLFRFSWNFRARLKVRRDFGQELKKTRASWFNTTCSSEIVGSAHGVFALAMLLHTITSFSTVAASYQMV